MENFIKSLIRDAGLILKKAYYEKSSNVRHKGNIDMVTETDLQLETFITKAISDKFPDDVIISEETHFEMQEGNRRWIIDPLDGTTNFVHRLPLVNISIGLEIDGEIRFGAVYNPIFDELFYAEKGKGAFLNDKKISVSQNAKLKDSLVATGFPYDRWEKGDYYIKEFLAFTKTTHGVRRMGAAAIDLCYVAAGRLDGFFERELKPWDMAAGSLMILEAGGKISKFNGEKWICTDKTIVASNGKIHDKMVEVLQKAHN